MKIDLNQWRLKKDVDRVYALHALHFLFFLLSVINHNVSVGSWGFLLIFIPLYLLFYRLYYRTLRELYYTYWTFGLLVLFVSVMSFFLSDLSVASVYLRLLGIFFLTFQMYILHTPIYYPIFNWWEYDFRYRDDIKVEVKTQGGDIFQGRLSDLRRSAGCLALFKELEVADELEVKSIDGEGFDFFNLKIMSKRETSVGRPFNYGVSFILKTDQERQKYKDFIDYWNNERKNKMRMKFQVHNE